MKIRKAEHLIFREYDSFGYLWNYEKQEEIAVSLSACILFHFLTDEYQSFYVILDKLHAYFDVSRTNMEQFDRDYHCLIDELRNKHFVETQDDCSFINEIGEKSEIVSIKSANKKSSKIINMPCQLYAGVFIITENCNNKCVHCYNSYLTRQSDYMTKEVFDKGLDGCINAGVVRVDISGGEALIHPDIIYFLNRIKDAGLRFRLYSNAQNVTKQICSVMSEMNLSPASITLYSKDPETHDTITQNKGSWENTIRGLELFKEYGIPFAISVPLTKLNIENFQELCDYCENVLGAAAVGPNPFLSYTVNHDKTNIDIMPSLEEIQKFARQYNQYALERGYTIYPPKKEKNKDYKLFNNSFYGSLTFCPNGDIVAGTLLSDIALGNVLKDDIKNLWKSSQILNEWRKYTISMLQECDDCPVRSYCEPNIGDNWCANHNLLKCDEHFCELNKVYYQELLQCGMK